MSVARMPLTKTGSRSRVGLSLFSSLCPRWCECANYKNSLYHSWVFFPWYLFHVSVHDVTFLFSFFYCTFNTFFTSLNNLLQWNVGKHSHKKVNTCTCHRNWQNTLIAKKSPDCSKIIDIFVTCVVLKFHHTYYMAHWQVSISCICYKFMRYT